MDSKTEILKIIKGNFLLLIFILVIFSSFGFYLLSTLNSNTKNASQISGIISEYNFLNKSTLAKINKLVSELAISGNLNDYSGFNVINDDDLIEQNINMFEEEFIITINPRSSQISNLEEFYINSSDMYETFIIHINSRKEIISSIEKYKDEFSIILSESDITFEEIINFLNIMDINVVKEESRYKLNIKFNEIIPISTRKLLFNLIIEASEMKNKEIIFEYLQDNFNSFNEKIDNEIKFVEERIEAYTSMYMYLFEKSLKTKKENSTIAKAINLDKPSKENELSPATTIISDGPIDRSIDRWKTFPYLRGYITLDKEIEILENRNSFDDYLPETKNAEIQIALLRSIKKNFEKRYNDFVLQLKSKSNQINTVLISNIKYQTKSSKKYGYEVIIGMLLLGLFFNILFLILIYTYRSSFNNNK
tara:strand:- start:34837 stop:36102 length:1266 start_codon:yes stop_codon:yes gene_type:complete